MKYYKLKSLNSNLKEKEFKTRDAALNYALKNLANYFNPLFQVEEILNKGNHNLEYVCSNNKRFAIVRCYR